MATKSTLTTAISGFTNGGENTAAEFRTFMTDFLDSVYPEPVNESSASTSLTTALNSSSLTYQLRFSKVGRHCRLVGFFKNFSAATGNINLFRFGDNEYKPEQQLYADGSQAWIDFIAYDRVNDASVECRIHNDVGNQVFRIYGLTPPSNAIWRFDITYNLAE